MLSVVSECTSAVSVCSSHSSVIVCEQCEREHTEPQQHLTSFKGVRRECVCVVCPIEVCLKGAIA